MTYKFLTQPLTKGFYEPEGIYLALPLEGECHVVQSWGENSAYYGSYTYSGVPLKGHNGIDFQAQTGASVLAAARGRVMSIGYEPEGWGRYIKLEHSWGESLYAHLGTVTVDAGQLVEQRETLATVEPALPPRAERAIFSYLHFAIRIKPYNRFDGWGGFVDPTAFLDPSRLFFAAAEEIDEVGVSGVYPHPMMKEQECSRRP
jgi:murein DD-endopeptidase MepM/ murein hydrolase activator NlpD